MDLSHPSARLIVRTCEQAGLLRNQCAYVLATAWHETAQFKYMREIWGPTAAQKRYEGRPDLGNINPSDGKKFMGRGFVQITGRNNYSEWARRLGLDLLKEPQLAEQPEIAARIIAEGMALGTFTGKKLFDYVTLQRSDFVNARRIVNGLDKADLIAGYAKQFDVLLNAEGYGGRTGEPAATAVSSAEPVQRDPALAPQSPPAQIPPSVPVATPEAKSGFWPALLSLVLTLFGARA